MFVINISVGEIAIPAFLVIVPAAVENCPAVSDR
jgi:hypothetical protein